MDSPEITLGRVTTRLVQPSALAAVHLARPPESDGLYLAFGALALRECWPEDVAWPILARPRKWEPGQSQGRRGQEIFDALASEAPLQAVIAACRAAYQYAVSTLISEAEVREAEGFSEALPSREG